MKLILKAATTSFATRVFVQDSSSTTGAGLTGLAFGSSGLKWNYIRSDQSTVTVLTPVTATLGTWTTSGFKEVDATNFPGLYEIGVPNAALASGTSVQMILFGAVNMAPCPVEIELTAADLQDGVRLGLTTLPNSTKMALLYDATFTGAVSSDATATTTTFTANTTGSTGLSTTAGYYSTPNSLLVFTSGTLKGKTAKVTGYAVASSVGTFTVSTLPAAPATADTFEILSLG